MKAVKQDRKVLFGLAAIAAASAAAAGFLLSRKKKAVSQKTEAELEYDIDCGAMAAASEMDAAVEDITVNEENTK